MGISTAIPVEDVSRTSGYQLNKGNFSATEPYLPQQIVVLAEANDANQSSIVTTPVQITSAAQAGQTYGYGSPIHSIARILFPTNSTGVGGIPVYVMAQLAANSATAQISTITITGTATANTTHYVIINGRKSVDFAPYSVNIVSGDTPTVIAGKYVAAINAVLGSPVTAANTAGVVTLTTKWLGLTAASLQIDFDVTAGLGGVSYVVASTTAGSGSPSIQTALTQFQSWFTIVINSYGTAQLTALESFNGQPSNLNPTGQYAPQIFQPFMAFFGNTDPVSANLVTITDAAARIPNVTNVLCPAPSSHGTPYEAAANMVAVYANVAESTPHLTAAGQFYPDMPVPSNGLIGDMSLYASRNLLKSKGSSTVTLKNGAYKIQDLVTTYHPVGEVPLIFNEVRYLNIDWNIKYGYGILEDANLKDKAIVADGQYTTVQNVVRPSDWKAILFTYFDSLASLGLINNPAFSKASLQVEIDPQNPNRFNTIFSYKRTGTSEIESTTVTVGF